MYLEIHSRWTVGLIEVFSKVSIPRELVNLVPTCQKEPEGTVVAIGTSKFMWSPGSLSLYLQVLVIHSKSTLASWPSAPYSYPYSLQSSSPCHSLSLCAILHLCFLTVSTLQSLHRLAWPCPGYFFLSALDSSRCLWRVSLPYSQ